LKKGKENAISQLKVLSQEKTYKRSGKILGNIQNVRLLLFLPGYLIIVRTTLGEVGQKCQQVFSLVAGIVLENERI